MVKWKQNSRFSQTEALDFKERLVATVKKEVKQVMEEAVTRKFVHEQSASVTSLCAAVEACLSQGLRRRALGLFFMEEFKFRTPFEHLQYFLWIHQVCLRPHRRPHFCIKWPSIVQKQIISAKKCWILKMPIQRNGRRQAAIARANHRFSRKIATHL